jgi:hypothetical protein
MKMTGLQFSAATTMQFSIGVDSEGLPTVSSASRWKVQSGSFSALGYTQGYWKRLEHDLLLTARETPATIGQLSAYG